MGWEEVALIIAQYGLPVAERIVQKWESGAQPTAADFVELRGMAEQTGADRMKAQLVAAGIPLDDPHAVALLKLAGGGAAAPALPVAEPPPKYAGAMPEPTPVYAATPRLPT